MTSALRPAGWPHDLPLRSAALLAPSRPRRQLVAASAIMVAAMLGALLLPWRQTVRGVGEVTALRPSDRPQSAPAVVGGQVAEWLVDEGQYVARGTPLVRIAEAKDGYLDPATLDRYREQQAAKRAAVGAKRDKASALSAQLDALANAAVLAVEKGRTKLALYDAAVAAAAADSAVAVDQLARRERLHADGLASLNDVQSYRVRLQSASARVVEKRQERAAADVEVRAARAEYAEKLAKARAERSATLADVSEGEADVAKLRNATDNVAARGALYIVRAPQDGYVVRAMRAGLGEQLKEGEPVVTIMPARSRPAVALRVSATDVALLSVGRKVRLQFDGWPALQFSGWPAAAVGTFGGEVAVIDPVAAVDGSYRVLVRPDPRDEPWPAQLRQGSRAIGWALLDEVRLGVELWRRVNGFPPSLPAPASSASPAGDPLGTDPSARKAKDA
jgi:multidrug resistance efflux pump